MESVFGYGTACLYLLILVCGFAGAKLRVLTICESIAGAYPSLKPFRDLTLFLPPESTTVGAHRADVDKLATTRGLGGRLVYPTAIDPGGRKRVSSRFFFKPGSDPAKLLQKVQNTKFALRWMGCVAATAGARWGTGVVNFGRVN